MIRAMLLLPCALPFKPLVGAIEQLRREMITHRMVPLCRESVLHALPHHLRHHSNVSVRAASHSVPWLCRYLLKVYVTGKGMVADTKREFHFWVRNYTPVEQLPPPIKVCINPKPTLNVDRRQVACGMRRLCIGAQSSSEARQAKLQSKKCSWLATSSPTARFWGREFDHHL